MRDDLEKPSFKIRMGDRTGTLVVVLSVYSSFGIIASVLGACYLAFSFLPVSLSENQRWAAGFVGFGVAITLLSKALIDIFALKERAELAKLKDKESTLKFLEAWARFEEVSRDSLIQHGERFDRHSVRSMIERLRSDGKITDTDIAVLNEALEARNSIVHKGEPLSSKILSGFTNMLVGIVSKIV